jgi:RNA-directed DNA polymerase
MTMQGLVSLRKLAWLIRVPLEELLRIADEAQADWQNHYKHFAVGTGPSKKRHIYEPKPRLKDIHRRLGRFVLSKLDFGDSAHGGIRGRSPMTHAREHLGSPRIVTNDIKSFFPSVSHRVVYAMLRRDHDFGRDVAALITRLTTIEGYLKEGAPTSGYLANLILTNTLDRALRPMLEATGTRYTRYVDDMAFSGDNPMPMISESAKLLSKSGLKVHRTRHAAPPSCDEKRVGKPSKLKIADRSEPQIITGLLTNCTDRLTYPRKERAKIRAAIHQLSTMEADSAVASAISSIKGRIARVRMLHPREAQRLQTYLDACAKRDLDKMQDSILSDQFSGWQR